MFSNKTYTVILDYLDHLSPFIAYKMFPYNFSIAIGSYKDGRDLILNDQMDLQTMGMPYFLYLKKTLLLQVTTAWATWTSNWNFPVSEVFIYCGTLIPFLAFEEQKKEESAQLTDVKQMLRLTVVFNSCNCVNRSSSSHWNHGLEFYRRPTLQEKVESLCCTVKVV